MKHTRIYWFLLLVVGAAVLLCLERPSPIEEARKYMYRPSQIRDSWLKPENANLTLPVRAAFVILVRNSELHQLRTTVRQLEDQFNSRYHYPYVFLNNEPFTEEFKQNMQWATTGDCHFGLVPYEHWSIPPWVDHVRARWEMKKMGDQVPYGASESYRKMCRYESGFFFRHPLLDNFDYYWRVEPGVEFSCTIPYDPFKFMVDNQKLYGFTITVREFPVTVKSLWSTTNAFRAAYPEYIASDNMLPWLTDKAGGYNMCHFWSNFEIGSLAFFRSTQYLSYFDFLDRAGGFFLERWGDAPVHSMAVAMFLNKSQVHYFDDIGYHHPPFQNCPIDDEFNTRYCFCNENRSMLLHPDSCTMAWLDL